MPKDDLKKKINEAKEKAKQSWGDVTDIEQTKICLEKYMRWKTNPKKSGFFKESSEQ